MQTQVLLENTSGKINYVGKPVKSIGYYSHNTNKKTISLAIHTINFVGRFILEGSLKLEPKDELDWFPIILKDDSPYIEYNDYNYTNPNVIHNNQIITLKGNYVWLRGKLDRTYLDIAKIKLPPYDLHSSTYVMTANVDLNAGSSHSPYPKSELNPIYDPVYYNGWEKDYTSAYVRQMMSSKLGNIEKVMFCF